MAAICVSKNGARQLAQMVEDLEILAGGMHHLEHALVGHQRQQRPEVEARRQRIDRDRLLLARDLHQAQLGEVGAVAHELGVDRDEALAAHAGAEGGERRVVGDQRHGGGVISGPSPRLTPQELSCPLRAVSTGTAGREALVSDGNQHASLSYAPLRRSAPERRRQRGAPQRLGTPKARSRPATLHRPARPCRDRAAGLPARYTAVRRRRGRAGRERDHGDRASGGAQRRDRQPDPADRRGRAGRRGVRARTRRPRRCRCRSTAIATIPRRRGSSTAFSTCAARRCTRTSCCARRSSRASAAG